MLLIVAIGAVVIIVSGTLGGDDDASKESDGGKSTTTATSCKPSDPDAVQAGYYVVTADDTAGLSGITQKTCVPVDKLIELNPNLDAQTLQVGNCVDLVKDGCKALASG